MPAAINICKQSLVMPEDRNMGTKTATSHDSTKDWRCIAKRKDTYLCTFRKDTLIPVVT